MKAMILNASGPVESAPLTLSELPDPTPAPGEARLRVSCCATCRTDLHIIEGDLPPAKRPVIPGHQVVGTVDALGPGCTRLRIGMRVGIPWLRFTCGVCHFCTTGRENLCERSRYTGYHDDGGYAEFATVPEAYAYTIPAEYSDTLAAPLLCAGIIGYRALQRCHPRPNDHIALYGFGSSAHIVLLLAKRRGHDVFVVTRSPAHQQQARDLGAAWSGADAAQMPARVPAAIIFAPSGKVVPDALAMLEPGGVLSLAGIHMSPIPQLDYQKHLFGERDIHPVAANTRDDGRDLLTQAAAANIRPHIATYPLADANRALQDLKAGRIDGTGVLLMH